MEQMKKIILEKSTLLTLLVTSSVFMGGTCVFAEEPVERFTLGEFVVTASRVATNKSDTPANISVITKESITDNNYSDAAEAISKIPGVNVLGSGAKGTSMGQDKILINGDERVLILVDGRRVNLGSSGNYSADWLPPVNAIERIEVLKGAGSALYGTDAVGGVINIITKKGSELESHVTVRAAAGSWNTEQYGITAGGATENGLGIFVSASKDRRGNYSYKDIDGDVKTMPNSGFNTDGVNLKLDQQIGKDNRITMQFEHLNTEGGSPLYNFKDGNYNVYNSAHKRVNNNVNLRYDWNESADNNGYIQLYRNYQKANFYSEDPYQVADFNEKTIGVDVQQNFTTAKSNQITMGLQYYKTEVENKDMYDGKRDINNKAVFIEDRWQFADSWQLNTGLRFDHHSKYGGELTPHIAVNKKINKDSNAYISWSRVFNAPTTDELYSVNASMGIGNPNLAPEKGQALTIGVNTKIGEKTNMSSSVFYSDIKDAIGWKDMGGAVYQSFNVDREKRRGMELSVNHNFDDKFSAYVSYTYVKVERDSGFGYKDYDNTKPNIYRTGLKYKNYKLLLNADITAVTGQILMHDSYGYTDKSYFTLDLGVQYKINKDAKVFIKGYNLTNARYQEYGGYAYNPVTWGVTSHTAYPMPSRSFIVGMEYNF